MTDKKTQEDFEEAKKGRNNPGKLPGEGTKPATSTGGQTPSEGADDSSVTGDGPNGGGD